jgi:hypothetical protein
MASIECRQIRLKKENYTMNAKIKTLIISIVIGTFVLSACIAKTPQPVPATTVPDTAVVDNPGTNLDTMPAITDPAQSEIQNKAADIVRNVLASRLDVDASSLSLVSVEPIDWVDACLGEAQEGEACAQVVTPGFRVTFTSGDQNYTYHTDLTGGVIRQETHVTQVS